jgi:pheromone a factor receptor
MAIYNFTSRRMQFKQVLQNKGGGLNTSRFVRLVALSSVEMLLAVPISAYTLATSAKDYLEPIASWSDVHLDWYRIDKFDAASATALGQALVITSAQRWIPVFASFAYFTFFGMQEEALTSYKDRAVWIAQLPARAINKMCGRSQLVVVQHRIDRNQQLIFVLLSLSSQ